MSAGDVCGECGAAIPADSPGRFCARCLLSLGLGAEGSNQEAEADGQKPGAGKESLDDPEPPPGGGPQNKLDLGIAETEKAGDRIGRYRLLEEIGRGGCGVVYMAEQEEPVRRKVALKVIKLGMDTRRVVARFGAERQALALMDHPNIARVLDAGATSTGRPYFVMELVGGIRITDYCDRHWLTMRQRLDLFIQVCRAIQHAHQKGIIHRDIKPSNVLVATSDGEPVPKVIDFGIAKAAQGRLTDQTLFTAFEQFLGTPAYMSPEQTELGAVDVDTRSDIYSLGVLLYELLTGKTPFDTQAILVGGLDAMRRTIREKEPARPSTRLSAMGPGELSAAAQRRGSDELKLIHLVRGDLDWIVMKCLEKDRARRYDTAIGLARDIERYLDQEPVMARPPSTLYKVHKFIRRNRVMAASATAIATVLVLGIAVSAWEARVQARLRKEAQVARKDATEKLRASYLSEARALRVSGKAGRRFESLNAVRNAAAIYPSPDLRTEAIGAMLLTDIRWTGEKSFTRELAHVMADAAFDRYAISDRSGGVSIRRVADDHELSRLPPVGPPASFPVRFSPDGRWLAVRSSDRMVRVWDWAKAGLAFAVPAGREGGFDFSPDSQRAASSDATNIYLHEISSGRRLRTFPLGDLGSDTAPGWFRFDPSGQRLALFVIEPGTNVLILDADSGETLKVLPHPSTVFSVDWHAEGQLLATAAADGLVYLWDAAAGERVRTLPADQVVRVAFNRKGNLLATSGWDSKTRLWELTGGRELINISKTGNLLGFGPDDRKLLLTSWDQTRLAAFEVVTSLGLRTLHERPRKTSGGGGSALFSHNGRLLACHVSEGLEIWDVAEDRPISTLSGVSLSLIGFSAGDKNLLFTSSEGLFCWPMHGPSANGLITGGPASLASAACADAIGGRMGMVSADGKTCAIVGQDRCELYRTDTFARQAQTGLQPGMRWVALSPDGSLLASGAWHFPGVKVWNGKTGELVRDLPANDGHSETSAAVAFSPDGRFLVTSIITEYCFWEVGSWSLARRLPQPPGNEFAAVMAFSPDSKVFAGMHSGNVVRLYDTATGGMLADLEAPNSSSLTALSFSPDGTQLAACESRDALRVWDLRLIRQNLAEMGLDWEMPPYPPKPGAAAWSATAPATTNALAQFPTH